ncbi:MAG: hypothetical protein IKQ87_00940 [Clostridia bacterium]|nr:hypothetical protein [Clostridia bacterium]
MTIEEAVRAARKNVPVVYDSPMLGPMLYARIGSIRKDFALRSDVKRGKPSEVYGLELLPMNGARSVTVAPVELVRVATPEELGDYRQYRYTPVMPEVHPELICDEVKKGHYNG